MDIHTSEKRPESMHTSRLRQLLLAVLSVVLTSGTAEAAPAKENARQELQAAELLEAAILARQPTDEDLRKMEKLFDGLVAKYPDDAGILNSRGEFLWIVEEPAKAERDWKAAERLDPRNAAVLNHLGGCALEHGEVKHSADYFQRAVDAAPAVAVYHFNLANLLYMFRRDLPTTDAPQPEEISRRAMHHYAEASRLEPLNEQYLRGYAETFFLLPAPDWHAALQTWERLAQMTANKDIALSNLARIHLKLGEKEKALDCLSKITNPDFNHLKAKLKTEIERE